MKTGQPTKNNPSVSCFIETTMKEIRSEMKLVNSHHYYFRYRSAGACDIRATLDNKSSFGLALEF